MRVINRSRTNKSFAKEAVKKSVLFNRLNKKFSSPLSKEPWPSKEYIESVFKRCKCSNDEDLWTNLVHYYIMADDNHSKIKPQAIDGYEIFLKETFSDGDREYHKISCDLKMADVLYALGCDSIEDAAELFEQVVSD